MHRGVDQVHDAAGQDDVGLSELVAWSLAAAQVADFLDFRRGPGSTSRITETALAPVLAGEPDGQM